jgi:NAD-dependent dihydropyrimidine dehydrogenase PreA subunit
VAFGYVRLPKDMTQEPRVLCCDCANASVLPAQVKEDVRLALTASGLRVETVADLCGLAARNAPLLAELASASQLTIAACHPRAVRWLFAAGGAPLPDDGVLYLDLRETAPEELQRAIRELTESGNSARGAKAQSAAQAEASPAPPAWMPWFPVIDYERCGNCQQCLGFCLFGVYAVGPDGTVQVSNPDKCKTGCPACARVCPSAAIIFPKYANAPINGGVAKEGDPSLEPVKVDRAALLSGDAIKVLQARGKNALLFSRSSDEFRAMQERIKYAADSLGLPDIPPGGFPTTPPKKEST